jgi:ammonia channel protein AmtB
MPALAMGAIGAAVCYTACTFVKASFGYDGSLDVVLGLRVARPAEVEGLDLSQHAEADSILV